MAFSSFLREASIYLVASSERLLAANLSSLSLSALILGSVLFLEYGFAITFTPSLICLKFFLLPIHVNHHFPIKRAQSVRSKGLPKVFFAAIPSKYGHLGNLPNPLNYLLNYFSLDIGHLHHTPPNISE